MNRTEMKFRESFLPFLGLIMCLVFFYACAHRQNFSPNHNIIDQDCPELEDGLSGVSPDSTYGYSLDNPVHIGGGSMNEVVYLNMLLGPNDEFIEKVIEMGNFWVKDRSLVGYKIIVRGDTLPKPVYLDTRFCRDPQAPYGLSFKKEFKEAREAKEIK